MGHGMCMHRSVQICGPGVNSPIYYNTLTEVKVTPDIKWLCEKKQFQKPTKVKCKQILSNIMKKLDDPDAQKSNIRL